MKAENELLDTYTNYLTEAIMQCESRGNPKAENWNDAKINGYPSIGLYQFYWRTWTSFAEKYKVLPNATKLSYKQILPYLYNPAYNAAVAHGMIKDGLASVHWKNCSKKLGQYRAPYLVFVR